MFLDEAQVYVASGRGGDGAVHFRREKYVPRGGPDGGDGGKGGDVVLEVVPTLNTLAVFRHRSKYRAENGARGGSSNKTGKDGASVIVQVPPGTLVRNEADGALLADLIQPGQRLVVCRGGRAGRGNARFATSRNQAPRMAERGEPGEERRLNLELRLIADIGIVGVPNAGKSTLLAGVTNARPKIAAYPFTTLEPNLGVAELDDDLTLVLADIPGLIEGAHLGHGLGDRFLKHIERTKVLVHLIDVSPYTERDPVRDFEVIMKELEAYSPNLAARPQIIAANKIDLLAGDTKRLKALAGLAKKKKISFFPISAMKESGLKPLVRAMAEKLDEVLASEKESHA